MTTKQIYTAPAIKVVEFQIERGFADSPCAPRLTQDVFQRIEDVDDGRFHHYGASDQGQTLPGSNYGW